MRFLSFRALGLGLRFEIVCLEKLGSADEMLLMMEWAVCGWIACAWGLSERSRSPPLCMVGVCEPLLSERKNV